MRGQQLFETRKKNIKQAEINTKLSYITQQDPIAMEHRSQHHENNFVVL